jgi:hypothetical protein
MASQCEPLSVWGSVLIITVLGRVIACSNRRSDGKTRRKVGTLCRVDSICIVSIVRSLFWPFVKNPQIHCFRIPSREGIWLVPVVVGRIYIRSAQLFSGCDTWPSEAALSGVKSKSKIKCPLINISWVIWSPAFEWWLPDTSNRVLLARTEDFSWFITIGNPSFGYCLPFTKSEILVVF